MNAVPCLDALAVDAMAALVPSVAHSRCDPAPPFDALPPIPIAYDMLAGHRVYRASAPIYRQVALDEEYCVQAFPKEMSDLLASDRRGILRVGSGDQKSYRLKYNQITASQVVWFAALTQRPAVLKKVLKKKVLHLGSQRKRGRGRIVSWDVEAIDEDHSWFAPHREGTVLMRNLPACDELPEDLRGYLQELNAVTPPYWHPGRQISAVVPC